MNGPAQIQGGAPAALNGSARCGFPQATQSTGRACFAPNALCEQLIEAVVPLLTGKGDLIDGKTDADVICVLKPVIGDFTVQEAIYLYLVLGVAEECYEVARPDEDPRYHALLRARWILQDFVGNSYISGPGCASARAWLARFTLWEQNEAGSESDLTANIARMMSWDVSDLRRGRFHGDRFFDEAFPGVSEPRWYAIMRIDRETAA